jgi:hypothetical protein
MLNEILALRVDKLGSKLYLVHSGSLTATSSSTALVHLRTRIRHLSDAFHKVRKSVSLRRISLKHVELPRGRGRKNVLSSKIFTTNQKNIQEMTNNALMLTCSSSTPFLV